MFIERSNPLLLNNFKKIGGRSRHRMGKDKNEIDDVEEGEISDSASVEEINEEYFSKLVMNAGISKEPSTPKGESRVWTMHELYGKYPACRGYATGLVNLAWAQAVQNKPLKDVSVEDVEQEIQSTSTVSASVIIKRGKAANEVPRILAEDNNDELDGRGSEKEEGELEEGEICLDSELMDMAAGKESKEVTLISSKMGGSELDSRNRVNFICKSLESITVIDAEKSFNGVCTRLQSTLECLHEVLLEKSGVAHDTLIQISYAAIQVLYSVFCSMNFYQKEVNKDNFSRFLSVVLNQDPPIFSPVQIKTIEDMMPSMDSPASFLSAEASVCQKNEKKRGFYELNKSNFNILNENIGHVTSSLKRTASNDELSLHKNDLNMSLGCVRQQLSTSRNRMSLPPLLDLHKVHDADSLPSPTKETSNPFFANRTLPYGDIVTKSEPSTIRTTDDIMRLPIIHPYETEALKAVSSYQHKFGQTSFFDRLPSPTPSEEHDKNGDDDASGEISSSFTSGCVKNGSPPLLGKPSVILSPGNDVYNIQGLMSAKNSGPIDSGSISSSKASAKNRDPRLRFVNDMGGLGLSQSSKPAVDNVPLDETVGGNLNLKRHNKTDEELVLEGHASKRQKNGFISDFLKVQTRGSGGWLEEDNGMLVNNLMDKNQLMDVSAKTGTTTNGHEQVHTTSTAASLPVLLKDLAVNPTMLLNLLKLGQHQKVAAESEWKPGDPTKSTCPTSLNSILKAVPTASAALSFPAGPAQRPIETIQTPSPVAPLEDAGIVRMKPRDPRRVLHNNIIRRNGSSESEQLKTNGVPASTTMQIAKDNPNVAKLEEQADRNSVAARLLAPSEFARQFTDSLRNIAGIVRPPLAATTSPSGSLFSSCQSIQAQLNSTNGQPAGVGVVPGVDPARALNTWGDVEHLFEGFDDKQKAAIQRERSRRIEEQKKMFGARKLCLVLDLDHTLLNSAKFVEVDPTHDEVLRKKEEQDREKSQRHLFRFSHMGMWTKLRPGIWNFLEKASKLYELHLYTMGNKLYATEMAKVLDPKGVLFNGRVISKGDDGDLLDGDERVPKSKDLEGVLGMESAVVIVDDSVRVWPHNKLNLIVVERYTYFPCSRRQFGLAGPSLLEIDHDERPEDGTLASSLAVIERIHQIFFSHQTLEEVDVRNILAIEQHKILAGCRIIFSRVFPVGEANPHLHPLWQTAEQFGAECTTQIDEQVTHVVANSLGTDKVNWALCTGRFVVHPGWVEASALLYRRANEQDFVIKS